MPQLDFNVAYSNFLFLLIFFIFFYLFIYFFIFQRSYKKFLIRNYFDFFLKNKQNNSYFLKNNEIKKGSFEKNKIVKFFKKL